MKLKSTHDSPRHCLLDPADTVEITINQSQKHVGFDSQFNKYLLIIY